MEQMKNTVLTVSFAPDNGAIGQINSFILFLSIIQVLYKKIFFPNTAR